MTISTITFSNEQARIAADKMAQAYYSAVATKFRWDSLGANQAALDIMSDDIIEAADLILDAFLFCLMAEKIWFLGVNSNTANNSTIISDGSPDDGRPSCTGAKIHNVMSRAVEFQNWLQSATQSFTDNTRNNVSALNTIITMSSKNKDITL